MMLHMQKVASMLRPPQTERSKSLTGKFRFDVNIEFAHVSPENKRADESFNRAYDEFEEYASACSSRLEHFSVSILIDDKEDELKSTYEWLCAALDRRSFQYFNVLYWGIESQLTRYREGLYLALNEEQKVRITRNIESYYSQHGALACSHDIAIWHLLRLGVIPPGDGCAMRFGRSFRALRERELIQFKARRIVSILSDFDVGQEDRADRDILQHAKFEYHVRARKDIIAYSAE